MGASDPPGPCYVGDMAPTTTPQPASPGRLTHVADMGAATPSGLRHVGDMAPTTTPGRPLRAG
ncbi:hypothetical protein GCM10010429_55920 [Micromonospora olivasterospora]